MNQTVEQEIVRLAQAFDMTPETVRKHVEDKMKEKNCNEVTAVSLVKADNSYLLKRIQGTYRIWPMLISDIRTQSVKDKKTGETADHDVVNVLGVFYGPIKRGGDPTGFLLEMGFWDDEINKVQPLNGQSGPFMFKGSLDAVQQRIYIGRDNEFQADNGKAPNFEIVLRDIIQGLPPMSKLMDTNSDGKYLNEGQMVAFTGTIADIVNLDSGRQFIQMTDMGADIVTVFPPDKSEEFTADHIGSTVLVYGRFKNGDRGVAISAKAIVAAGN